jgi:membrane-associated phospholipid phosphatase
MRVNGIDLYARFVCCVRWFPWALVAVGVLMGCTGPSGRHWGFHVPTVQRIGKAAAQAATSPTVWVPTAGALVFTIDDWDEKVAAWAADNAPLFGSASRAAHASDLFRDIAVGTATVAAVATPTGPEGSYHLATKLWDVGLGVGAVAVTSGVTERLKDVTNRARPDGSDSRSFPSGHASTTAVTSTLALRYVDAYPLPAWGTRSLKGALITLPYAAGWARLEANQHFPSDVLVGIALGNFFGTFVNALLKGSPEDQVRVVVTSTPEGLWLGVHVRFPAQ